MASNRRTIKNTAGRKEAGKELPNKDPECESGGPIPLEGAAEEIVKGMLAQVLAARKDMKPTVADVIRLLQYSRELGGESIKEVKVRWVDPSEMDSATSQ